MRAARELSYNDVRRTTAPESLVLSPAEGAPARFIGQERAVRSVGFGLAVERPGYNIFIVGPQGSGRTSYAQRSVAERAAQLPAPDDWVYVSDFDDPSRPLAISLPAGTAKDAGADFARLVADLKTALTSAFEQSSYEDAKAQVVSSFQEEISHIITELREAGEKESVLVKRTPQGFVNIPLHTVGEGDEAKRAEIPPEEFEALSEEERAHFKEVSDALTAKTLEALRLIRDKERALKERLNAMEAEVCRTAAAPCLDGIRAKYGSREKMARWIDSLERHIVLDSARFLARDDHDGEETDFTPYKVNVLVSHDPEGGAPVVSEVNPTFYNLAGKMEYESRQGYYHTDFTHIVGGALHRANGGFLILEAEALLRNFMSYDLLKRVLRSGSLSVENLSDQFNIMPIAAPRPEPVPVNVKVILIGSYEIYYLLQQYDPEFSKLFKISAEFDTEMPRTPETELDLARFIAAAAEREKCLPFTAPAMAELIEWASRLADDRNKLSTRFNRLLEYIVEASAWARADGAESVGASHVLRAISEKHARAGLTEQKIREAFEENIVRVDTDGTAVGQINGLAVVSFGDILFGHPTRITANTFMGEEGVINIERETSMAGPIHNKGLLTLSSYLGRVYAQDMPLALSARLAFEQNYGGIEGDSASSTELYCLLSSLAEVPIAQNIAVTGSVDQFGNVQPIGGVNEKIEGFFRCCLERGLTGTQGVMIPWQNEQHLMLAHDVVDAVRDGRFHIWSVRTVDEGIALLTGLPAGKRRADGTYPPRSVHGRAMAKLKRWLKQSAALAQGKTRTRTGTKAAKSTHTAKEDSE